MAEKRVKASVPKLISGKILVDLENNLIARKICTEDLSADIKNEGDTVYFTGLADPTVNKYEGTITYEDLKDGSIALLIDQEDYVAFKVKDVEKIQSQLDIKGAQTQRATYRLRNGADKYVLTMIGKNTDLETIDRTSGISSANVLSATADVIEYLETVNVFGDMRWGVVTPWFKQKLVLAGIKFQINNGMGKDAKGGLSYAEYQDTMLYVSNNVYNDGTYDYMPFGSYNSVVFANQILNSKFKELESSFAKGYASLHVYGSEVVKPKEIVILKSKKLEETAI